MDGELARDPKRETAAVASDRETAATAEDKLEIRLWLRLLACSNRIEQDVRQELRTSFDMTLPRFDLLSQLERAPDGLTMGELSRRLMVTSGNVTGLIDRLVAEELVRRAPMPNDRRAHIVRLTPEGERAFGEMIPKHEALIAQKLGGMKRGELRQLLGLLGRLKDSLNDSEQRA